MTVDTQVFHPSTAVPPPSATALVMTPSKAFYICRYNHIDGNFYIADGAKTTAQIVKPVTAWLSLPDISDAIENERGGTL